MSYFRLLRPRFAWGFPILLCATGDAFAFNLRIGFSVAPEATAVPLSPWAMAGLSILVAFLGFISLRRRSLRWGEPWAVLLAAGLLAAVVVTHGVSTAQAFPGEVSTINLVFPSPMTSAEVVDNQDISIVNATGQTIRIDQIEAGGLYVPGLPPHLISPSQSPRCLPGLILSTNAVCFAKVIAAPS